MQLFNVWGAGDSSTGGTVQMKGDQLHLLPKAHTRQVSTACFIRNNEISFSASWHFGKAADGSETQSTICLPCCSLLLFNQTATVECDPAVNNKPPDPHSHVRASVLCACVYVCTWALAHAVIKNVSTYYFQSERQPKPFCSNWHREVFSCPFHHISSTP